VRKAGRIGRLVGGLVAGVDAWALPQRCPGCAGPGDPDRVLCPACWDAIPRLALPLCARCLSHEREPVGCGRHAGYAIHPAWVYDAGASHVVRALKYDARPHVARALGAELARAVSGVRADLVLEVPLHPARRRSRGYNQAAELADALSETIGVPRLPGILGRVRATREQAGLSGGARRANVRGAFHALRPGWLKGRNVLVVDDVVTTGATLEACLDAVASAGARAVAVTLAWAQ